LRNGTRNSKEISLAECVEREGLIYYREKLLVPDNEGLRFRIIDAAHSTPGGGHPGRFKTFDTIQRSYYWPGLRKSVERYCRNCHACTRAKPSHDAYHGLLKPLTPPSKPWQHISMDFIVELPESKGHTSVLVIVDRLTKMR